MGVMKFADLAPKHRPALLSFARRYSKQPEDLVQDTFLRAFTYWDKFTPTTEDLDRDVSVWLKRILTNTYYTQYARGQKAFDGLEAYRIELTLDEGQTDFDNVTAAVESLESPYKELIELYYFKDKTYRDIVKELKMPLTTVHKKLHAAEEMVKELLTVVNPPSFEPAKGPKSDPDTIDSVVRGNDSVKFHVTKSTSNTQPSG